MNIIYLYRSNKIMLQHMNTLIYTDNLLLSYDKNTDYHLLSREPITKSQELGTHLPHDRSSSSGCGL